MKYMRKNSFVVCLVISAILLTSSFAMPVLAAENTGIETSSVTRSVPGYYKCTGSDVNIRSGPHSFKNLLDDGFIDICRLF